MKKTHLISALLLSGMILIPNTAVFAATNNSNSKDVVNTQVVQENKEVKSTENVTIPPFICFTKYDWSTTVSTTPYKWYKINGPSGNYGNFQLHNPEGTHYKSLGVFWNAPYAPKDMKIKIYNNNTGGSVTHSVSGKSDATIFTDLRSGNYTIYVITGSRCDINFRVEDYNPGW